MPPFQPHAAQSCIRQLGPFQPLKKLLRLTTPCFFAISFRQASHSQPQWKAVEQASCREGTSVCILLGYCTTQDMYLPSPSPSSCTHEGRDACCLDKHSMHVGWDMLTKEGCSTITTPAVMPGVPDCSCKSVRESKLKFGSCALIKDCKEWRLACSKRKHCHHHSICRASHTCHGGMRSRVARKA